MELIIRVFILCSPFGGSDSIELRYSITHKIGTICVNLASSTKSAKELCMESSQLRRNRRNEKSIAVMFPNEAGEVCNATFFRVPEVIGC